MEQVEGGGETIFGDLDRPHAVRLRGIPQHHPVLFATVVATTVAAAAGEIALLNHASYHAFRGNSDGATVVLEGQWMSAGHLALSGWDLSLDSFWTLDAVFYTIAVRLFGVHGQLLTLVPSVIAVVVIAVGLVLALPDRATRFGRVSAGVVLLTYLAFPANNFAYVFLQGPWHVGTVLAALVAFWALSRGGLGWRTALAALCLAAGLLGDTQIVALGLAPVLGGAILAAVRRRSLAAGAPGVVAIAGGMALAYLVRTIARAVGTFAIATGYPRARAHQIPENIAHLGSWGISLLGHGALPTIAMDNAAGHVDLIRIVTIGIFVCGIAAAVACTGAGVVRGRATSPDEASGWRIDDLLLCGVVGDAVLFVAITPNDNGNYARYLTAGIIFGVVLTARMAGRLADRVPHPMAVSLTAAFCLIAIISAVALPRDLRVPAASQPDIALAGFLEAHHLEHGLGDYWSASLTSVESADRVEVRPVIPDAQKKLVRYGRQSSASWYRGVGFTFLVYDLARPWRDVDATTATATFGPPARRLAEGSYRILVWNHPIYVSTVGFSNK